MAEKKTILTLNLGSQRIGMARFSLGAKGTLMLRDYAFEELPGDINSDAARKAMTAAAVKALTAKFKATGADVNYSIPSHNTITRFVKVPSLGEDQVDKIVGFEAQQAVPFPLSETVWDYQIVGDAGGEVEVVIGAIRAEQLEEVNQGVAGAGLNTRLVDAGPLALYNAFRYNFGETKQSTLLLDIGSRMTDAIFMDGDRLFVASFPVAGSNVTSAIAKEMDTDFANAEIRKKTDGFVHLGGNYADHEDPEVDAMSKIIRNQLTRVHSEINRRVQQFKTLGGNSPTVIYLAGAAAGLPYMKEFLEEKLRLPVHWFNALQNVGVGPKVDVDAVSREAHCLGELVGLALRQMSCPMELDLSPRSVEQAREVGAKKPMLITAAVALFAGLGALYTYLNFSTAAATSKLEKVESRFNELNDIAQDIRAEESRQKREEARADYLKSAVTMRQYWLNMFNLINSKFTNDEIWLTQLQPLDPDGQPILGPILGEGAVVPEKFRNLTPTPPAPTAAGQPPTKTVDSLHLAGLFKKDEIRELFERLKSAPEFDVPTDWETDIDKWFTKDQGKLNTEWASRFDIKLPLKNKFKLVVPVEPK